MTTTTDVAGLGTVLGVWAHPDDEAFLTAGLMLLARRAGNRVVCVTATAGEHGTDRPDEWPPARLAEVRTREHRAALAELGVTEVHHLGYVDGTCADADPRMAARALAEIMCAVRPDTVVTFGPDGMTGHPDHRAVSGWTTAALRHPPLRKAGVEPRLLHATVTPDMLGRQQATNERLGAFPPGLPVITPAASVAVRLVLDDEALDRKYAALRAHASQTGPQEQIVGAAAFREWWREEAFAAPSLATALTDSSVVSLHGA
jgi:LmbE family N-acetylglucosaminyl deacetylase